MIAPYKIKAANVGTKATFKTTFIKHHSNTTFAINQRCIPRDQLPSPLLYYKKIFSSIMAGREWVNVRCCFHNDSNPSLSLNLKSGGFYCHACGAKGGDLIAFHRLYNDIGFKEAVKQLTAMMNGGKGK